MHEAAVVRGCLALLLVVIGTPGCSDSGSRLKAVPDLDPVAVVKDSSASFLLRARDTIGLVEEGRFFAGGVVILDRYEPYLKLFTLDGRLRWSGGRTGGGPAEFRNPQAIGARSDSTLLVLQRGRVSEWKVDSDSLALSGVVQLPAQYLPLGAVAGCQDEWLLYARDDAMFDTTTWQVQLGPEVSYLHSLRLGDGSARLSSLYSESRNANTIAVTGHSAVMIGKNADRIVLHHRAGAWSAGEILEFGCEGRILRSQPEEPLISADSLAQFPVGRPLQWTAGVVAVDDGWLLAIHRFLTVGFYDVPENQQKTEVFHSKDGVVVGSVVVDGMWIIMDYDPRYGVLMACAEPEPHFIRVPLPALIPSE
jgi:hypothetical protein